MKNIQSSWVCVNGEKGYLSEEAHSLTEYIFKMRRAIATADFISVYDENNELESQIEIYHNNNTSSFDYFVYRKLATFSAN